MGNSFRAKHQIKMALADMEYYAIFVSLSFISISLIRSFFKKTAIKNHLKLPPSPPRLLVLGHLRSPLHLCLDKLSKKYGPFLCLQFGASRQVLISSASIASEIFRTHDLAFASRPPFARYVATSFLSAQYGEYWKLIMKKLCVTKLFCPQAIEASRQIRKEEIRCFLKKMLDSATNMKTIDVGEELVKLTNNSTCRTVMNVRCSEEDNAAERCSKLVQESFALVVKLSAGDILGPFKSLAIWLFGKQEMDVGRKFDELVEKILKEHEERREGKNGTGDDEYKDLMDTLLDVYYAKQAEFKLNKTQTKSFLLASISKNSLFSNYA